MSPGQLWRDKWTALSGPLSIPERETQGAERAFAEEARERHDQDRPARIALTFCR